MSSHISMEPHWLNNSRQQSTRTGICNGHSGYNRLIDDVNPRITFSAAAAMTSTSDDETSEDNETSGDDEEYDAPLIKKSSE